MHKTYYEERYEIVQDYIDSDEITATKNTTTDTNFESDENMHTIISDFTLESEDSNASSLKISIEIEENKEQYGYFYMNTNKAFGLDCFQDNPIILPPKTKWKISAVNSDGSNDIIFRYYFRKFIARKEQRMV